MTFINNVASHIQGSHKHCYSGTLAVGVTLLGAYFLDNTHEFALGATILGVLALYTLSGTESNDEPET